MARSVTGPAIASSLPVVDRDNLARRADRATAAPANDGALGVSLVERRIAGLLAAEYRSLIAYARRLTGNGPEAADLVHNVYTRVLSQPAPIAAVGNPSGWLRTVLFRSFVDLRRRERWEIATESAVLDRRSAAPQDEPSVPQVTLEDVRSLVARLAPHYRVPYELFSFCEMSYAQIAVVLGLSRTTVGTRINRARARLRQMLHARQGG